MSTNLSIDHRKIASFCRQNCIRKLAFFGSILREDFGPDSDVDILVEFDPDHVPGFIRLYGLEEELSILLGGHKPDIVTFKSLNRRLRDRILSEAEDVVWDTVIHELPPLITELEKISSPE